MRQKMWGMLYFLLPPKEFQETTEFTDELIKRVKANICATELHINIAVSRPLDNI